jgi:DNA polymerase/3'-5' exonuclease PolX
MGLNNYSRSKGFSVKYSEGLMKDGKAVAGETENSVFCALGLETPKPEDRKIKNKKPIWLIKT